MEHVESTQSEQGQVSAPGESPKDENQNTYTEGETSLAARFGVEPKLVRLLNEIVQERFRSTNQFIDEQLAKNEAVETQEQPEQEQPVELTISEQTQERLKSYYKNLEPRTKLAILTLSEMRCLDGINFQCRKDSKERLCYQIEDDLENVCIETFHKEPDDVADIAFGAMNSEDVWLAGVWEAVRMVLQNC